MGLKVEIAEQLGESESTARTVRVDAASVGYVDERMAALSELMELSMTPAMALLPSSKRNGIEAAYANFKELIPNGDAE